MPFFSKGVESSGCGFENCYASSNPPGMHITKNLGLVQFTIKGLAGDTPEKIAEVFEGLMRVAREKGANAVINATMATGAYEQQGSRWQVTYLTVYGDAVIASQDI